MSEKPLEELKRICLICGCHTNQTINIFEPRSGPNIVQLIQIKFKFQPLNEDKYLCFSCNNWLINWHSLQAVNCNDESDKESGKFRCQINGAIPEEENDKFHRMSHSQPMDMESMPMSVTSTSTRTTETSSSNSKEDENMAALTTRKRFPKRLSMIGWNRRIRKARRKCVSSCCLCGRLLTKRLPLLRGYTTKVQMRPLKCQKCRRIFKWRAVYLRALFEDEQLQLKQMQNTKSNDSFNFRMNLVNDTNNFSTPSLQNGHESHQSPFTNQYNQNRRQQSEPLVDGKVVSMLQRLGTTLSQENSHSADGRRIAQIMSTNKKSPQKQKWSRKLADDEILIDFNTAITEVLPFRNIRQKLLKYQISSLSTSEDMETIEIHSDDSDNENDFVENAIIFDNLNDDNDSVHDNYDEDEEEEEDEEGYGSGSERSLDEIDMEEIYGKLPKGLTVSIISSDGDGAHL